MRLLKCLITLLLTASALDANALDLMVTGKKGEVLHRSQERVDSVTHVGALSAATFEKYEIPFEGGDYGVKSLFGLAQDIEVVSDTEMKAFGWCFSVDGVIPETMADQTRLEGKETSLEWFYAYAHYKGGEWIAQCVRANR